MQPQVLKGFRDYLPKEMLTREAMIDAFSRTFKQHGFAPIQTPALEYATLLTGKYGEEGDKLMFRFLDNGERDVALRYDLTVPLARFLASNLNEITLPFRRYHIAPVWRAEKPARGRFREFMQCDVDIVGAHSFNADAEVIATGIRALLSYQPLAQHHQKVKSLRSGATGLSVRLSHRKILSGLCEKISINSQIQMVTIFRTIDKLEKQGREAVEKLLQQECGLSEVQRNLVFEYLACPATPQDLTPLRSFFAGITIAEAGIAEVEQTIKLLQAYEFEEFLAIDLSIARGLDYYTGLIYESSLNGLKNHYGSIMSGGRYDQLIGEMAGKILPAVGISIGLDRLLSALIENEIIETPVSATQVLVTVFSADQRLESMKMAHDLRQKGINTEVYLEDDKLGKQIKYADKAQIPYVIIAGPEELAQGVVKIKTLKTQSEITVARAQMTNEIKQIEESTKIKN